jgi:hypothetical protein
MNGAPVNIIPAPLAGQLIVPDQFVIQTKPGVHRWRRGDVPVSRNQRQSPCRQPRRSYREQRDAERQRAAPPSASYQPPAATGIVITNATAAFATGNGTMIVTAYYSVITLG